MDAPPRAWFNWEGVDRGWTRPPVHGPVGCGLTAVGRALRSSQLEPRVVLPSMVSSGSPLCGLLAAFSPQCCTSHPGGFNHGREIVKLITIQPTDYSNLAHWPSPLMGPRSLGFIGLHVGEGAYRLIPLGGLPPSPPHSVRLGGIQFWRTRFPPGFKMGNKIPPCSGIWLDEWCMSNAALVAPTTSLSLQ